MRSLPKPLIGLLLGTIAFFALWMVALKPSSSSSGATPTAKTNAKVAPTTKSTAKAAPAAKAPAHNSSPTASTTASAASEVQTVQNAVRAGNVVAVLFYNGAAADDLAMKSELASIPTHKGQVVKPPFRSASSPGSR